MQPYFVMPTHLKLEMRDGIYPVYKINDRIYYPQQFHWVPNRHLDYVLDKGGRLTEGPLLIKPDGLWLSDSLDWVSWCQTNKPAYLLDCTPLKAYLLSDTKICELHSIDDFTNTCRNEKILSEEKLKVVLNENILIRESGFFQNLSEKGYSGIHLGFNGEYGLRDIFMLWNVDSTVIFDKTKLKFELLTSEELKELGWDHYKDIITLEDYKGRKKNNRPTPSPQAD
ncbi:hypothetical protein KY358_02065 [Candidatus Woesearchaeota archaeon]|nr:hypothetical protein [Candidatus Woesearchaeota archaeon]